MVAKKTSCTEKEKAVLRIVRGATPFQRLRIIFASVCLLLHRDARY